MALQDKINEFGTSITNYVTRKVDNTLQDLTDILGGAGTGEGVTFALNDLSNLSEAGLEVLRQNSTILDTVPTENSANGITSGAVYAALGDIATALDTINGEIV